MNTEKLRELMAAATPGPWLPMPSRDGVVRGITGRHGPECVNVVNWNGISRPTHPVGGANAALIVAAVNAMPSLLARLEAAEKVVEAGRNLAASSGYALWQHNGGGTPMHNHWSASLERDLAELDTALTTYDQEKAREHG